MFQQKQKYFVDFHTIILERIRNFFFLCLFHFQVKNIQSIEKLTGFYLFPIERNAAVYNFRAKLLKQNVEIIAKCKEKKQAQKEYDEAVSQV